MRTTFYFHRPFAKMLVVMLIPFISSLSFAADENLTNAEKSLLLKIKSETILQVQKQLKEAITLQGCFRSETACPAHIRKKLPQIRRTITEKVEEYRILVALKNQKYMGSLRHMKLSYALPTVTLDRFTQDSIENKRIFHLIKKDNNAINSRINYIFRNTTSENDIIDPKDIAKNRELKKAEDFYFYQGLTIIHQIPFIIYFDTATPANADIVKALSSFMTDSAKALRALIDPSESPLESFLIYEPVIRKIIKNDPAKMYILKTLIMKQTHTVGLNAWLERNSLSIKLAAFSTCSFVSAVLQAWPLSIACGGAATAITGRQLYDDYNRMHNALAHWLMGTETYSALKTSQARVLYSSMAMFLCGQGLASGISSINSSLTTALAELPSVAAARMSSLSALREGSVRFTSRTIEMKGKDLGASLLAGAYAAIGEDSSAALPAEQRIFTYSDYLLLQRVSLQSF